MKAAAVETNKNAARRARPVGLGRRAVGALVVARELEEGLDLLADGHNELLSSGFMGVERWRGAGASAAFSSGYWLRDGATDIRAAYCCSA